MPLVRYKGRGRASEALGAGEGDRWMAAEEDL